MLLEECVYLNFGFPVERVTAHSRNIHKGQIDAVQLAAFHQLFIMRGNTDKKSRSVFFYQGCEFRRLKFRDDFDLNACGKRHMQAAGKAVGDKRRHNIKEFFPCFYIYSESILMRNAVYRAIGQHNALCYARCAAGVDNRRYMVLFIKRLYILAFTELHQPAPSDSPAFRIFAHKQSRQLLPKRH